MFLTNEIEYVLDGEFAYKVRCPNSAELGALYAVLTAVDDKVNPFLKFAESAKIVRPLVVSAPDLPEVTQDKHLHAISQELLTENTTLPDIKKK